MFTAREIAHKIIEAEDRFYDEFDQTSALDYASHCLDMAKLFAMGVRLCNGTASDVLSRMEMEG